MAAIPAVFAIAGFRNNRSGQRQNRKID